MIEILKKLIRGYGSAIGPVLAFVFGILTMIIKYRLDKLVSKRAVVKSYKMLKKLINSSTPPNYLFDNEPEYKFNHARLDNLTNISRFFNKLLSIKSVFDTIDKSIIESHDISMIREYNNMKWWFNFLFKKVEEVRNSEFVELDKYSDIMGLYNSLKEATTSPELQFNYIENKNGKVTS